jgi:hypothetical protein
VEAKVACPIWERIFMNGLKQGRFKGKYTDMVIKPVPRCVPLATGLFDIPTCLTTVIQSHHCVKFGFVFGPLRNRTGF